MLSSKLEACAISLSFACTHRRQFLQMLFEEAWHERQSELLEGQDSSAKRTIRKMEEKVHQHRRLLSISSVPDAHRTDMSVELTAAILAIPPQGSWYQVQAPGLPMLILNK